MSNKPYKTAREIRQEIAKLEAEAGLREYLLRHEQLKSKLPYGVEQQLGKRFDSRDKGDSSELSVRKIPDNIQPYMGLEEDYFDRLVFEDHRTKLPYWDDS